LLPVTNEVEGFVVGALGHQPRDLALFERALTHGSAARDSYERLEFLGDRVLGLIMARWLFERFSAEPEGKLSSRLNALVAGETCAEIGREIGVPKHIRLGKQARDDRANTSDNVIGDVVEALIGALLLDGGFDAAESFVKQAWGHLVDTQDRAPQHPKSALQELAAARNWGTPVYEMTGRTGAHHAPLFTVSVTVRGGGEASGEGTTKQDAEKAAAIALLENLTLPRSA
jgi:ribonuclease-3